MMRFKTFLRRRSTKDRPIADGGAPPIVERPKAAAESVIEVERLSLCYRDVPAFKDISITIPAGRITALIGPSGCGKTSFLSSLNRLTDLIPYCRVTGRATIASTEIFSPETDTLALRRRIGMIFQKPNPFPLSVRKNIELPLREHRPIKQAEMRRIVERVLCDVGLWEEVKDRLDAPALALSGGQKQRLCIARALALEPEVMLFDEPCSALDPISSGVVENLISRLAGRYTMVVVTHNLAQARRIADEVAVFWVRDGAGQLIESGSCRQIFENPTDELTSAYIRGMRG